MPEVPDNDVHDILDDKLLSWITHLWEGAPSPEVNSLGGFDQILSRGKCWNGPLYSIIER